jgi:hypothetical protein
MEHHLEACDVSRPIEPVEEQAIRFGREAALVLVVVQLLHRGGAEVLVAHRAGPGPQSLKTLPYILVTQSVVD